MDNSGNVSGKSPNQASEGLRQEKQNKTATQNFLPSNTGRDTITLADNETKRIIKGNISFTEIVNEISKKSSIDKEMKNKIFSKITGIDTPIKASVKNVLRFIVALLVFPVRVPIFLFITGIMLAFQNIKTKRNLILKMDTLYKDLLKEKKIFIKSGEIATDKVEEYVLNFLLNKNYFKSDPSGVLIKKSQNISATIVKFINNYKLKAKKKELEKSNEATKELIAVFEEIDKTALDLFCKHASSFESSYMDDDPDELDPSKNHFISVMNEIFEGLSDQKLYSTFLNHKTDQDLSYHAVEKFVKFFLNQTYSQTYTEEQINEHAKEMTPTLIGFIKSYQSDDMNNKKEANKRLRLELKAALDKTGDKKAIYAFYHLIINKGDKSIINAETEGMSSSSYEEKVMQGIIPIF